MENKVKLLGQVFSGELVAKIIAHFIKPKAGLSVLDPMCGIGDLLMPYYNICDVHGIEIDSTLRDQLKLSKLVSCVNFDNAFNLDVLMSLAQNGYDIVVTNPPYIRKENLKSPNSNQFSLDLIKSNLISFTTYVSTLNLSQKDEVIETINSISGLADLAVMAWILCMLIVKDNGYLGIVVPNSWLTREYAKPVKNLLLSLFDIEVIINDVNNKWFEQRAQVKTNIVICKRRNSESATGHTKIISLYSSFNYNNLDELSLNKSDGIETFLINASDYLNHGGTIIPQKSLRSIVPIFDLLPSLSDYDIKVSQGLRSGANKFFYLKRVDNISAKSDLIDYSIPLSDEFFLPLLHKQSDLNGGYYFTSDTLTSYVLYIQDSVTSRDLCATPPNNRVGYFTLPYEIERYINCSEHISVKGSTIPQLSSVKTNAIKGNNKRHRFWYMLPVLQDRHLAPIVLPRVNSNKVTAYINPSDKTIVIDANFLTFCISKNSLLNKFSLLAILNSSFCRLQYEEIGTPMGGGALKLDAVQIQRLRIPSFKESDIHYLTVLGKKLAKTQKKDSNIIIDEIDEIILHSISSEYNVPNYISQIKDCINHHASNRL